MSTHPTAQQLWAGLAALCCLSGLPALADEASGVHPFLTSKYSVQLGAYNSMQHTTLRVNGSAGTANDDIDFDEQLDLRERHREFAMEFVWRFGKKWSTRMQYFAASRQEQAVLEEDIEWEDELIQAGSSVVAGTDFELTRVFFARSFDKSPRFDYGAGLGIHWLETGAFIEHDIITSFGETSAVSASGPLPNIGAWYYYSPSEKWYFGGRVDWFEASVGEYSGGITNAAVGVNYRLFDHVGAGLKYQLFSLDVEVDNSGWRGGADLVYQGWYVYLSGHWK